VGQAQQLGMSLSTALCYHTQGILRSSGRTSVAFPEQYLNGRRTGCCQAIHHASFPLYQRRRPGWGETPFPALIEDRTSYGHLLEVERVSVQIYGDNWVVILFMIIVAFFMGMLLLTLNQIVAPSRPTAIKAAPYESGVPDVKPVRPSFTPRFYIVAMLFVVFDLEVVFIYPWAVSFDYLGLFGFVDMVIFLGLLLIGFIYAWKKGALEWV
jgi:NADH-quinone oxidoreductase subunit A